MQFYLAHNFAAREFLKLHVIPTIESLGHKVVARWVTEERTLTSQAEIEENQRYAMENFLDISAADYVLHCSDDSIGGSRPKNKYIEVGYALACGKRIIVQGEDRESSVFYFMQNVNRFRYIEDMYIYLGTLPRG